MIFTYKWEKLLFTSIISQIIPQRKPVNIMIFGKSSIGASTIMKKFIPVKKFKMTEELTGQSYMMLTKKVPNELCIIAISDFNSMIKRKKSTSDFFMSKLLSGTWEGIGSWEQGGKQGYTQEHAFLPIISKVTTNTWRSIASDFYDIGLLQRLLLVHIDYTEEQWMAIRKYIYNKKNDEIEYTLPSLDNVFVDYDPVESQENLMDVASRIADETSFVTVNRYGKTDIRHIGKNPRYDKMLLSLTMGVAVYNHIVKNGINEYEKTNVFVNKDDYLETIRLCELFGSTVKYLGEYEPIDKKFIYNKGVMAKW